MMGNLGCLRTGDVIASASDIDELLHYRQMKEQGRLIILPEDMDLKKLIKCTDGDGLCPRDVGLTDRCELSCLECWLAALKGAENAAR